MTQYKKTFTDNIKQGIKQWWALENTGVFTLGNTQRWMTMLFLAYLMICIYNKLFFAACPQTLSLNLADYLLIFIAFWYIFLKYLYVIYRSFLLTKCFVLKFIILIEITEVLEIFS